MTLHATQQARFDQTLEPSDSLLETRGSRVCAGQRGRESGDQSFPSNRVPPAADAVFSRQHSRPPTRVMPRCP